MFDGLVGMFRDTSSFSLSDGKGGFNSAGYYDYQRGRIANQGLGQIFDVIGGIGSKLSAAWAARDYADQVAQAQAIAYENARKIAAAQKESITKAAEFSAQLKERNANILFNNAYNMQQFALQEKEQGFAYAMRVSGDYEAEFSNSGVQLGTGSTRTTEQTLIDDAMFKSESRYKERLNQIHDTLNKVQAERVSAEFDRWSAQERGRFLDANVDIRLY